jgi:hypothetical protein
MCVQLEEMSGYLEQGMLVHVSRTDTTRRIYAEQQYVVTYFTCSLLLEIDFCTIRNDQP